MHPSKDPSAAKEELREHLLSLSLPPGLLSSVFGSYRSCHSRVWLLDNSVRMKTRDCHIARSQRSSIEADRRGGDATRWDELKDCVLFHANMSSKCWIPTKFFLVNDPSSSSNDEEWHRGRKFTICSARPRDVPGELDEVQRNMDNPGLNQNRCPLRYCIETLRRSLEGEASRLESEGRHVTLVICTQGRPTTRDGMTGSEMMRDLQRELMSLSKLPVRIIIRLCTDSEEVREMYNSMDANLDSLDVLDDYWGEVRYILFIFVT